MLINPTPQPIRAPHSFALIDQKQPSIGAVLLQAGYAGAARSYLREETTLAGRTNYGMCLRQLNLHEEAWHVLTDVLLHDDTIHQAWNALGMVHLDRGEFEQAETSFRTAYDINHHSQYEINMASCMLRRGAWREASTYWEQSRMGSAWDCPPGLTPILSEPECDGSRWLDLLVNSRDTASRLLLIAEGGYGDVFLLDRYRDLIRYYFDQNYTYWCWPKLAPLYRPYINFQPIPDPPSGEFTFAASIQSLPMISGNGFSDIPEPDNFFRRDLPVNFPSPTSRLGICWRAEENGVSRKHRSIPDPDLQILLEGRQWVSLCPGVPCPPNCTDPGINTWEDTAALISQLDTVVSVDTAVAHLSCALGKRTIILLPTCSDWKWGLDKSTTEWWPTATLIRNKSPYFWTNVLNHARSIL
jgi:tetratricopeptide (TPR) repeat protein